MRWLSLQEAVTAVKKCWPALVAALGEDAAKLNKDVANGLAKKTEHIKFVLTTSLKANIKRLRVSQEMEIKRYKSLNWIGLDPASIYKAEQGFPG